MKIGVLNIQGSKEEHFYALKKAGADPVLVKKNEDFQAIKGLILPGGESTTIGKLLRCFDLRDEIIKFAKNGFPIWGTCAGAILMAKGIEGSQKADGLNLMDVIIERNAYGRQLDSFETEIEFRFKDSSLKKIPAIFIRAPKIVKIGGGVEVLSKYKDEVVAAREGNLLITTFHPELTEDPSVHKYFIDMCKK
jgi:5'-phosphate synthase pdxT subunit